MNVLMVSPDRRGYTTVAIALQKKPPGYSDVKCVMNITIFLKLPALFMDFNFATDHKNILSAAILTMI